MAKPHPFKHRPRLTPKMRLFIEGCVAGKGQAASAVEAGYSARSATTMAKHLSANPFIRREIERRLADVRYRTDVKVADLVGKMMAIATPDIRDFYDQNGQMIPVTELGSQAAAVRKLEMVETFDAKGVIKTRRSVLTLHDPQPAVMTVAKLLGMIVDHKKLELVQPTPEEQAKRAAARKQLEAMFEDMQRRAAAGQPIGPVIDHQPQLTVVQGGQK